MKKPDPKMQRLMNAITYYAADSIDGVTLRSITADLLIGPVQAREALQALGATEINGKWPLLQNDAPEPEPVQPTPAPAPAPAQPTNLEGWVFIDSTGTFKTAIRPSASAAIEAMEQLGQRSIDVLIKAQGLRLAKVRVVTETVFVMGECA